MQHYNRAHNEQWNYLCQNVFHSKTNPRSITKRKKSSCFQRLAQIWPYRQRLQRKFINSFQWLLRHWKRLIEISLENKFMWTCNKSPLSLLVWCYWRHNITDSSRQLTNRSSLFNIISPQMKTIALSNINVILVFTQYTRKTPKRNWSFHKLTATTWECIVQT